MGWRHCHFITSEFNSVVKGQWLRNHNGAYEVQSRALCNPVCIAQLPAGSLGLPRSFQSVRCVPFSRSGHARAGGGRVVNSSTHGGPLNVKYRCHLRPKALE
ncbi:hypothetical protein QQF64_025315 [Cirrhinus molitorella]|uniref:Uncharacterized protein n=1 Tax=Cirrhinus molitorella TaxID=172907 RepID=A0ABR3NNQ3_9TELE